MTSLLMSASQRPYFYCFFAFFICFNTWAAQPYQLIPHNHFSDLASDKNWLTPIALPNNQDQLLMANQLNQIYLTDANNAPLELLVDLNKTFASASNLTLTAIAIHPSFALKEQEGSGVFFTAHIEDLNNTRPRKRLNKQKNIDDLAYDVVLMKWHVNVKAIDSKAFSKKQEILRIAVPQKHNKISLLDFNPHSRSWNNDYGLLYIALSGNPHAPLATVVEKTDSQQDTTKEDTQDNTLFSGALLRILPEKFSLKQYTTPQSNPFISNKAVHNEVILFGSGEINSILWQKSRAETFFIQYEKHNSAMFSLAQLGDDWQQKPPKTLWQSNENEHVSSSIIYSGAQLKPLHNQLVFLLKNAHSWQLFSLTPSMTEQPILPKLLWQQQINKDEQPGHFSLLATNEDELLIFDQQALALLELFAPKLTPKTAANSTPELTESALSKPTFTRETLSFLLLVFLFLATGVAIAIYRIKYSQRYKNAVIKRQFARFELRNNNQQIALFNRHIKEATLELTLADISQCQLILNDNLLYTLSSQEKLGFNEGTELNIRKSFAVADREKMVDNHTRQFTLTIVANGHQYPICLYYRRGNQRLTKTKFTLVLEQVINFCWQLSATITPEHTGERELAQQAQMITSHDHVIAPSQVTIQTKETATNSAQESIAIAEVVAEADGQIVDALEKLATLKQEGLLTASEFEQAKSKLLHDLLKK